MAKKPDAISRCERESETDKKLFPLRLSHRRLCQIKAIAEHPHGPKSQQAFVRDAIESAIDEKIEELRALEAALAKVAKR